MALPAPNLDDRRFQDLVDDAKRLVQQRCPEWTDHNVSDPGVTLIELFAWMTDQVLYRLNRVPGPQLRQVPRADRRAPVPADGRAQPGHVLAVRAAAGRRDDPDRHRGRDRPHRHGRGDRVHDRSRICRSSPAELATLGSMIDGKTLRDHMAALEKRLRGSTASRRCRPRVTPCSSGSPRPCPPAPSRLRFKADIEGVGVDPTNPPLVWEAWTGDDWEPCDLDSDDDRRPQPRRRRGHPRATRPRRLGDHQAARRLAPRRVVDADEGQPVYSASPKITGLDAITDRRHVRGRQRRAGSGRRMLGVSEDVPGQQFGCSAARSCPGDEDPVLEVSGDDGWEEWT